VDPRPIIAPAGLLSMSSRQWVQQSVFLVLGDIEKDTVTLLYGMLLLGSSHHRTPKPIVKFFLPAKERVKALRDLRLMNITRGSLFPGLDGFAQSLAIEAEF
jgi:hypothetical protein